MGDKKYIAKGNVITPAETLAQVGDKQYATLQAAIDAANGATVHVLKDVALTSSLNVPAGKTLTLNLAGRKVMVSGANYALVNNGNLKIVDMDIVSVVAAEATIGDDAAAPILIMSPSANDGIAVIDDATGGSIAGIQNNGSLTLESGAVVAAAANVPAIDNAANAVAAITGGTVEGTLQSMDKNALTITGGSFTGNFNVSEFLDDNYGVDSNGTVISYVAQLGETKYQTLEAAFAAAKEFDVVAVLDDSADVSGIAAYVAQGLFPISNGDKTYTLRTLPKATVEKLPAFTLTKARDAYMCWPNGDAEIDRPLDIVMNFLANDDGKAEANESGFADWKCDFYLTLSDMTGSSITADGCYLAGNYGGFGWIVIPVDGEQLNNSDTYPVVAAYDANITYRQVCESVKKFTAAIHVADAIMEANPDLKITLQLKMTNDKDSAQELVVGSYTYTIDDLKGRLNPPVNVEANVTVDDVFKANVGSGLANAYQAAEGKLNITIVEKGDTFSLIDVSAQDDYGFPAEGLAMTFPAQSVADGEAAIVVHEHDGKKYVFTGIVEYGYVTYNNVLGFSEFTVGDTAALNAAIAEGGEIVLSSDIVLSETLVIPAGKTVTLDLNGKKLSHADEANKYAINNLGTLTLKDSVGTGSVDARGIYNGYGNGADNVATAKIIIQSGTYNAKGTNGGAAIFNYGIAEINGGSFTSIGGYSLNNQAGSSMTIADGVTANNGIYCSNAKVTVNGGNISGNRSGCHVVYAWNAELTINGGTFYNNNSGNATIMSAGTTKCTITGGTFGIKDGRVEGNGNTWTSCLTDTANTATMTVTGGIFNGGFRVQAGTTMTIEGGSFNDVGGSGYGIYGTASVKGGTFTDTTAQNFAKDNLADGFELNVGGNVVEILAVAQIGEIKYATLSEALAAVTDDAQTVTVLKDVTENLVGVYLRGNIVPAEGKNITVTLTNNDWVYCPYTFVLGAGITLNVPALFYYAGGTQINGKLIVNAYYQRYAGTKLTINEPGSMTVTTDQFYLRYTDGDANAGIYINGDNDDSTIGLNTSVIYFYQGMINAKNANIKSSVYWQTNETDGQGSANLVLDNSKLNVTVNEQKVKATGNSTVTLTNDSELIAPGGFEVGGVLKSSCDITGAISKISDQATIEISGGTYTQDVSDWCVDGYAAVKTLDNKYVVSAMPTATVSNLGSITVGLGDYKADAYMMYDIINGGKLQEATVPYDLTLAMDFKAKDTAETAAQNAFGNYTTDFFITMSGMSGDSFVGKGCYLAGYYPSFKAWVKIPLDGFTVENGKVYPVITSAGFDFKYTDICGTVGQFICGIYLTPEVLAANPNLTVDLTLGLAENKDAALNAQFFKVDNYVYDADDLQPVTLPEVVITDIKSTLTDADPDLTFALNFAIKDVDKLSKEYLEKLFAKYGDYYTDYVLTISGLTDPNGSVKFNANGNGDGYLAGQYDAWSKSWVTVPFSDVTVKNGQSFYIMEYAAELMGKGGLRFTLKEIAEIVQNFDCGVYFTPEFLAANPNLKVELELKVFTEDESGNKVGDISVATNTFDKDDFSVEAAKLDIRIVNGKPQIGFAGEGKLVLNAATALTGEWTKNVEYTAVENDGDDTKTWVTPKDGYYFFKGYIVR